MIKLKKISKILFFVNFCAKLVRKGKQTKKKASFATENNKRSSTIN